jgi:hypothetical protein
MDKAIRHPAERAELAKSRAYDPNNLHPLDREARKYDDTSYGIDWDEILATTEDDELAGRYAFSSAGYPDDDSAMTALKQWMDSIVEKVLRREAAAASRADASGR